MVGGGVDVRGAALRDGNPRNLAGGGGVAVEGDRSSNARGEEQGEGGAGNSVRDGGLQSPSSEEEEARQSAGVGEGGVSSMHVVKRDGRREPVMFDKITARIRRLCWGLDERYIDPVLVAQKVGGRPTLLGGPYRLYVVSHRTP